MGGKKRTKSKSSPTNDDTVSKRVAMATNNNSHNPTNQASQVNHDQVYNNQFNQQHSHQNLTFPMMSAMQNQQYYSSPVQMGPAGGSVASPNTSQYNLPPPCTPTQNIHRDDQWSVIISRLDGIEQKLTQLDTISLSVNKITDRLDKLDQKTNRLEQKMQDIENSRKFDSSLLEQIQEKQKEIDLMVKSVKSLEKEQEMRERQMKEEIIDLKSRSMRDNLIFFGHEEERGERDTDCVKKVLTLLEEKLGIENAKTDIKLHRAHRMGKYNPNKTRPIVAKFAYYPDRERVRQSAKNLQKPYGISQQFPKEIMDRRRELVPIMLNARREGKEAYLVGDKLYIGGRLYRDPAGGEN